jgi:sulfhydrogenase subunit beta (sulfur reductase)
MAHNETSLEPGSSAVVDVDGLEQLLDNLKRRGYQVVGPTLRDGAIVYDEISVVADLPAGWTDQQDGGSYRVVPRRDGALFGYAVGPHSWKKFLHPPVLKLWEAKRTEQGFVINESESHAPKYAFLAVRSCELHAIAIQDRVFRSGKTPDPSYAGRCRELFIIALNCSHAGGTCFCVSMHTGPKASEGFDLALTEILDERVHLFAVDVGSELGAEMLSGVRLRESSPEMQRRADAVVQQTADQMGRKMDADDLKGLLYRNYEHPRWDDVADRCLACGNCTMVCPTCFCTTVEDTTDLEGEKAERWRKWDSCFNADFSYIHGGTVRSTTRSRYRQWMTHKLATWIDQFGTSGCVGCGRCITWCPVGIDITEEVGAIRETQTGKKR